MKSTDINLLRNQLETTSHFSAFQKLISLYVIIGIVAVEVLVYGGLYVYGQKLATAQVSAQAEAAQVNQSISRTQNDLKQAIRYQQEIANQQLLLGNHVFWSPVFDELSKFTYRSISFDAMNGSLDEHQLTLTGTASSFTDLAKLILGLKQSSKIKDVSFQSSGNSKQEKSGYSFTLEVTLDPKIFKQ